MMPSPLTSGAKILRAAVRAVMMSGVGLLLGATACSEGGTTPPTGNNGTPSVSLSAASTSATVVQGGATTIALQLSRQGAVNGAVNLAVSGAPAGVTATASPAVLNAGQDASTLSISVAGSSAVGTSTLTVTPSATGATANPLTIALTVQSAAVPSLGIATSVGTASVARTASQQATITVTRGGGFSASVDLTALNVPSGVTATFAPATLTGTTVTSTLTLAVAAGAALATSPIVVRATGGSLSAQATLSLTVTPAPTPAGSVTLDLSACYAGTGFMAVQNGDGAAWVRVTGQNGRYTFAATAARIGIVYVDQTRNALTNVVFATQSDIATLDIGQLCVPYVPRLDFKRFVLSLTPAVDSRDNLMFAWLGSAEVGGFGAGPLMEVLAPTTGVFDLAAMHFSRIDSAFMIVRRNIDVGALPDGAVINPPLQVRNESNYLKRMPVTFTGTTGRGVFGMGSFVGLGPSCTIAGVPQPGFRTAIEAELLNIMAMPTAAQFRPSKFADSSYVGWGSMFAYLLSSVATPAAPLPSVLVLPNTVMGASDVNGIVVSQIEGQGVPFGPAGDATARGIVETFTTSTSRTIAMPEFMPAITPQNLSSNGYRRLRFQFALPADVGRDVVVRYHGADRNMITMRLTPAYLGARTVDIATPDFTGLAGWLDQYGPHGTATYEIRGESDTRTSACSVGRTAMSSRYGII